VLQNYHTMILSHEEIPTVLALIGVRNDSGMGGTRSETCQNEKQTMSTFHILINDFTVRIAGVLGLEGLWVKVVLCL